MFKVILIFIAVLIFVHLSNNKKTNLFSVKGGDSDTKTTEREKIKRGNDALKYIEKYSEEIKDELKQLKPKS